MTAEKHKLYSNIANELLTAAKKQYTTLWDANYSARQGILKLKKHFEDNTIPTALNMKYFRLTSSSINYSTVFDLPEDFDSDKEAAVKMYMKSKNEECQADLLVYQRSLIQRCIADKDFHLQQTDGILEEYDDKIQQKWARQLSASHRDAQAQEICRLAIQEFRNWKLDFHYHRHKSAQSAALKKTRAAANKAAAEQMLQDKYANFTSVQLVQESIRLSKQHASKHFRQPKTIVRKGNGKGTSTKKPLNKSGTGAPRNTSAKANERNPSAKANDRTRSTKQDQRKQSTKKRKGSGQ